MKHGKITQYPYIAQADLFAVLLAHFATFHSFVATVAAIVLAGFVVVAIVAIAVIRKINLDTQDGQST